MCIRDSSEDRVQEAGELELAHLARRHRELAMLDLPETADMAIDPDVVRRIHKHHLGEFTAHQRLIVATLARIATQDAMPVSYTHLDVYKRQDLIIVARQRESEEFAEITGEPVDLARQEHLPRLEASRLRH